MLPRETSLDTLLEMEMVEKRWLSREPVSLSWTLLLIEAELDSKESSLRLLSGLRLGNTTLSSSLESD